MALSRAPVGLRPFVAADADALAALCREAILELAAEDYSDAQCAAWVEALTGEPAGWVRRLGGALTLVALVDGEPAGFGSLKGADVIDLLFVAPGRARTGVASALLDAIEKLAAARGAPLLKVDASETARPLFERRGYVGVRRNSVALGDEWLADTTMEKPLQPR